MTDKIQLTVKPVLWDNPLVFHWGRQGVEINTFYIFRFTLSCGLFKAVSL